MIRIQINDWWKAEKKQTEEIRWYLHANKTPFENAEGVPVRIEESIGLAGSNRMSINYYLDVLISNISFVYWFFCVCATFLPYILLQYGGKKNRIRVNLDYMNIKSYVFSSLYFYRVKSLLRWTIACELAYSTQNQMQNSIVALWYSRRKCFDGFIRIIIFHDVYLHFICLFAGCCIALCSVRTN